MAVGSMAADPINWIDPLEKLFIELQSVFQSRYHSAVTVVWGRKQRQAQDNIGTIGRIILVPGAENGGLGQFAPPKQPGRDPRPLWTWMYPFHFLIFARVSNTKQSREELDRANYRIIQKITKQLLVVLNAITHHPGNPITSPVTLGAPVKLDDHQMAVLGEEYLIPAVIESPILDVWDQLDYVDVAPVNGDGTTTLGNYSREIHIVEELPAGEVYLTGATGALLTSTNEALLTKG
jgi:hypothetical protein